MIVGTSLWSQAGGRGPGAPEGTAGLCACILPCRYPSDERLGAALPNAAGGQAARWGCWLAVGSASPPFASPGAFQVGISTLSTPKNASPSLFHAVPAGVRMSPSSVERSCCANGDAGAESLPARCPHPSGKQSGWDAGLSLVAVGADNSSQRNLPVQMF